MSSSCLPAPPLLVRSSDSNLIRCPSPGERLIRANAALRAAGLPELALLEVASSDDDYPVGVTGKVLKRQLRERYADLSTYGRASAASI